MILAGDIGGTKTLLGLFDAVPARPRPVLVRSFGTLDHPDLQTMIAEFLKDDEAADARAAHGAIESACFGVAGPVIGETVKVTNVPWFVDARRVATALGVARVALLNDLEALAHAVPVLRESETHVLQEGEAMRGGNIGLIAAGTGPRPGAAPQHRWTVRAVGVRGRTRGLRGAHRTRDRADPGSHRALRSRRRRARRVGPRPDQHPPGRAPAAVRRGRRPRFARRAGGDVRGSARPAMCRLRGDARSVRRGVRGRGGQPRARDRSRPEACSSAAASRRRFFRR